MKIAYVISPTHEDFLQYQQENPKYKCEMITKGEDLRGRSVGKIVELDKSFKLWNYQDLLEHKYRLLERPEWQEAQDDSIDDEELEGIDYAG